MVLLVNKKLNLLSIFWILLVQLSISTYKNINTNNNDNNIYYQRRSRNLIAVYGFELQDFSISHGQYEIRNKKPNKSPAIIRDDANATIIVIDNSHQESHYSPHCDRISQQNYLNQTLDCIDYALCKSIQSEPSERVRLLTCGINMDGSIKICCPTTSMLEAKHIELEESVEMSLGASPRPAANQRKPPIYRSLPTNEQSNRKVYSNFPEHCGTRALGVIVANRRADDESTRIIGGDIATPKAWPWFALIFIQRKPNGRRNAECGGTLISERYVLTAAHCILDQGSTNPMAANKVTVRLGEDDLRNKTGEELELAVAKIIGHPDFESKTFKNDIALLELKRKVSKGCGRL